MDCSLPGSSVHRIFKARILKWVAISFSRGSSWPRDQTRVSCIACRCFTLWANEEGESKEETGKGLERGRKRKPLFPLQSLSAGKKSAPVSGSLWFSASQSWELFIQNLAPFGFTLQNPIPTLNLKGAGRLALTAHSTELSAGQTVPAGSLLMIRRLGTCLQREPLLGGFPTPSLLWRQPRAAPRRVCSYWHSLHFKTIPFEFASRGKLSSGTGRKSMVVICTTIL